MLLGQFLREDLLLVVKNLEVLLRAQELVVVILGFLLCLEDLVSLGFDDLLKLPFLDHHEIVVSLLSRKLSLKPANRGS